MKNIISAIVLSATAFGANAASFDCAKATTKSEKFICANESISALDSKLHEVYVKAVKIDPSLKQEQRNWNKTVRDTMINIGQIQPLEAVYNAQIQNLMNVLPKEETVSESDSETSAKVEEEQPKQEEKAVEQPKVEEKQPEVIKPKKTTFSYICPKVVKITTINGMSVEDDDIMKRNAKIQVSKRGDIAKIMISSTMQDPVVMDFEITDNGTMINSEDYKIGLIFSAKHGAKFEGNKLVDDESKLTFRHIYDAERGENEKRIEWRYTCEEVK